MLTRRLAARRLARLPAPLLLLVLGAALAVSEAVSALTLQQLPYRDPSALEALLAQDDARLSDAISSRWPSVQQALDSVWPAGERPSGVSVFFDTQHAACVQAREPAACRLLMDLLAVEMRARRAKPPAAALPVLMRPAQLAWKDTALPRALLARDAVQWQSALEHHWPWVKSVVVRFLPDPVDLHPVSKVFGSLRDTCQATHTEVACRHHLADIVAIVEANRGQPPTVVRTLAQIPYRDPVPLERLLALDEQRLRSRLADWTMVDALLNRYIPWSVAIAGDTAFARARLDCQAWFPGDIGMCRHYIGRLARLMRSKASLASPYAGRH